MSFSCADNRRYNDALVALPHNTMSTRSRSIRGALVGCLCSDGTRHLLVGSAARAGVFALWQQASVRPRRQPGSAGSAPASRRRLDAPRFGGGRRHANPSRLRSPGSLIAKGPWPSARHRKQTEPGSGIRMGGSTPCRTICSRSRKPERVCNCDRYGCPWSLPAGRVPGCACRGLRIRAAGQESTEMPAARTSSAEGNADSVLRSRHRGE